MAKNAINVQQSIAANSTVNVLAGTRFENVPATGLLTLAQLAAATGVNAELFVSQRNNLENSPVPFETDPVITIPDDIAVDDVECFVGEKIQLRVTNTTAGAIVYVARLILDDNVAMR